jgi:hypothetical protein
MLNKCLFQQLYDTIVEISFPDQKMLIESFDA